MIQKKEEKPKEQKRAKGAKSESGKPAQQLEDLRAERDELFEKLQRVSADRENIQKRAAKQIAEGVAYEKERIIKSLLPALDNFEHTLQNAETAESTDVLIKGIRIVYDQMLDILKSYGVEQIEAKGEDFDPVCHQAMLQQSDSERQDNVVLEEFQKGYRLNNRVIRPSKVVVNKLQNGQENQQEENSKDTE